MIYENILEAAGNTPLIRLQHMTGRGGRADSCEV